MPAKTRSIPDAYANREQAMIKHALLQGYLEKLVLIIGMSASRLRIDEICYVDCFAGPWDVEDDALGSTSIAISLGILARCHNELKKQGVSKRLRALFIEKDDRAYSRLRSYVTANTPNGVGVETLHGDFLELSQKAIKWCGDKSFAFFFVDPTGWTEIKVANLLPLLDRPSSEVLITFVYDWINRLVSNPGWEEDVSQLLGKDFVLPASYTPSQREDAVVATYRRQVSASTPRNRNLRLRSAYRRVLDPTKDRTKYHLVYLTRHPRGIIEFMQISEDVESLQTQVRAEKKDARRAVATRMSDLFGADSFMDAAAGHARPKDVQDFWLKWLSPTGHKVGVGEFADILEQTNWFPTDLQAALGVLIEKGRVRNKDASKRRRKNHVHWDKNEYLELVTSKP